MDELQIEKGVEKDIKDLKKSSADEFNRILSHIMDLKDTPRPTGALKIVGSKNDWRLRIGKYRVIYEIDDRHKVVRIFRVKHRREAYK